MNTATGYGIPKLMLAKSLLSMILLTGTVAWAEGPLADRGGWALGVPLPSSSERSISLWKVRSPVTALGLEIGLSSHYGESTIDDLENLDREDLRIRDRSLRMQLLPAIKHYRPLHEEVAPFVIYKVHTRFAIWDRGFGSEFVKRRTRTEGDLGLSVGLGTEWFPFQRISLSGQTGLDLSYRYEKEDLNREWEWSLETFQTEMTALVYF